MDKLGIGDLYSLEEYARHRAEFRARVIEHKRHRRVHLGDHLTLCFEDRLTMQYQVQEMLRTERIFEPEGIAEELAAYNPLIPDGHNLKATLLLEYTDPLERAQRLAELRGIEHRCWLQVGGFEATFAIADEDIERSNEEKTSAVHFLRFELTPGMIAGLRGGAVLTAGIDLPSYAHRVDPVPAPLRAALLADLAGPPTAQ